MKINNTNRRFITVTIIGILLPSVLFSFPSKAGNTTHSASQQSAFMTSPEKSNTSVDTHSKHLAGVHHFESLFDDYVGPSLNLIKNIEYAVV